MSKDKAVNPFEILLPYQRKIFNDRSRFIICKLARQCGKSLTIAARAVYRSLTKPSNLTVIVSVNQRSANELLNKVKTWCRAAKIALPDAVEYSETASQVSFGNGSRIISLPANPASLRGYSGDVILDEFALLEGDEEIYAAVLPVITSKIGGEKTCTICSTPTSLDTMFAKIWHDDSGQWSKHSMNIYEAVSEGLKADPDVLKKVVNDDLIWQTEYMAEFASGAGQAFPKELFEDVGYDILPEGINRWFLGYDVARRGDYSVMAMVAEKDGKCYVDDLVMMKDQEYARQLEMVKSLNLKYGFVSGYTDAVGIGGMMAETIQKEVNPMVRPFMWTAQNKTQLHDDLRTMLQDKRVFFRNELLFKVVKDAGQMRRYVSHTGRISYASPHTPDGHSDIVSAVVLGTQAARLNPMRLSKPIPYFRRSVFD